MSITASAARVRSATDGIASDLAWAERGPIRRLAADGVCTLAAGLAALAAWRTTFDSLGYLAIGAVGLLVGIGAVLVGERLRRGWLALPVAVVAYLLLAPVLCLGDLGPRAPIPGQMLNAAQLVATGWMDLLTTLPPVDSSGSLSALSLALGIAIGGLGLGLARSTESGLAPGVVPVAAYLLVLLMGLDSPGWGRWSGLLLAGVLVVWATLRRRRRLRVVGPSNRARTQIVIGAVLLLGAGTIGYLAGPRVPGVEDRQRLTLRSHVTPPLDINQFPTPLASFRRFSEGLDQLWGQEMLTVEGVPAGTRVRVAVLDAYDGTVWGASHGVGASAFRKVGRRIVADPVAGTETLSARITIAAGYADQDALSAWLPGLGAAEELGVSAGDGGADAVRYNPTTGQALLPTRLRAGDVVTVAGPPVATVPSTGIEPHTAVTVDPAALAAVADAASDLAGEQAVGPWARAVAAGQQLQQNGAFSDGTLEQDADRSLPGHGLGRLTEFLGRQQPVGSDEQFAAAYALIANQLGVPARVVLGAVVPAEGAVLGSDMRAWVEVRDASGRWYAVPNAMFMPDRSQKPSELEPEDVRGQDPVEADPRPARRAPGLFDVLDSGDPGTFRADAGTSDAMTLPGGWSVDLPGWVVPVAVWVGRVGGVLAAAAALLAAGRAGRRWRRRSNGDASRRLAAGWQDLADHGRDLGLRVPAGATRAEQARVLGHPDLAALADRAIFGLGLPPDAAVDDYWARIAKARRALSRSVPRHRRLLRPWSPASLLAGAPGLLRGARRLSLPRPRPLARRRVAAERS